MVSLQKTSPLDSYGLLFKVEQTSNGEKNLSGLLHLVFEDEQKSYGIVIAVSISSQNCHFRVNYPFNSVLKHSRGDQASHNKNIGMCKQ